MKWLRMFLLVTMSIFQSSQAQEVKDINYLPPEGVVRNEKMAVAIAEVVLSGVYGTAQIKKQRPFMATLTKEGVWLVIGSFNEKKGSNGGVAEVLIRKKDGAVVGMIHGQ